jgi:hypothetical protein
MTKKHYIVSLAAFLFLCFMQGCTCRTCCEGIGWFLGGTCVRPSTETIFSEAIGDGSGSTFQLKTERFWNNYMTGDSFTWEKFREVKFSLIKDSSDTIRTWRYAKPVIGRIFPADGKGSITLVFLGKGSTEIFIVANGGKEIKQVNDFQKALSSGDRTVQKYALRALALDLLPPIRVVRGAIWVVSKDDRDLVRYKSVLGEFAVPAVFTLLDDDFDNDILRFSANSGINKWKNAQRAAAVIPALGIASEKEVEPLLAHNPSVDSNKVFIEFIKKHIPTGQSHRFRE